MKSRRYRHVRGTAIKFYTEDGNYDLVGNDIPVFFIQSAIKFPDLVHAIKPEPQNHMPQATGAHRGFSPSYEVTPPTSGTLSPELQNPLT